MRQQRLFLILAALTIVVGLLLTGCGGGSTPQAAVVDTPAVAAPATEAPTRTPEPSATPAPTQTPTPLPSPTPPPTPIPYDLTLQVEDEQGAPLAGADVTLSVAGSASEAVTDESGLLELVDLAGADVDLEIWAQGYLPASETVQLERGVNEVVLTLERDPYGILPSEACAEGEALLYLEDFQSGMAPGWDEIEFAAQGWGVQPDTVDEGNLVATVSRSGGGGHIIPQTSLRGDRFDDAVWRLKVRLDGDAGISTFLNWLHNWDDEDSRYIAHMGPEVLLDLGRLAPDSGHLTAAMSDSVVSPGEWHDLTLSRYEGEVQVWLDGEAIISYTDPNPLPSGTIGLEPHFWEGVDGSASYDDISVCELSQPYAGAVPVKAADALESAAEEEPAPTATAIAEATEPEAQAEPTEESVTEEVGLPVVASPQDAWGLAVFPPGSTIKLALMGDTTVVFPVLTGHLQNVLSALAEDADPVGGVGFELVSLGGGCDEQEATDASGQVLADPAIVGVVGPLCSRACASAGGVLDAGHVVMVSPSCSAPDVTEMGYATVNRVTYRDDRGGDEKAAAVADSPEVQQFLSDYESRFGGPVEDEPGFDYLVAYTYDAAGILVDAIYEVAVMDEAGNVVIGRQALAEAVRATNGYQGVTGSITLDAKGDRQ